MNRRKFLAFLAAGGVVTATGLWMPGQKVYTFGKRHYPTHDKIIAIIESWKKKDIGWQRLVTSEMAVLLDEAHPIAPFMIRNGNEFHTPEEYRSGVAYVTQSFYMTMADYNKLVA